MTEWIVWALNMGLALSLIVAGLWLWRRMERYSRRITLHIAPAQRCKQTMYEDGTITIEYTVGEAK